jgi:hypothetical protein
MESKVIIVMLVSIGVVAAVDLLFLLRSVVTVGRERPYALAIGLAKYTLNYLPSLVVGWILIAVGGFGYIGTGEDSFLLVFSFLSVISLGLIVISITLYLAVRRGRKVLSTA